MSNTINKYVIKRKGTFFFKPSAFAGWAAINKLHVSSQLYSILAACTTRRELAARWWLRLHGYSGCFSRLELDGVIDRYGLIGDKLAGSIGG